MKQIDHTSALRLTRIFYLFLILVLAVQGSFAQNVGINASGAAPNANAGLDVDFSNKGVLIPRVALVNATSASPLSGHVAGMIVYNTATTGDVTPGFFYNTGSRWVPGFPAGTTTGDMLYWNGAAWVRIPAGSPGQLLQFSPSGIPAWGGSALSTITTAAASSILDVSATSGGNISSDGGSAVLSRGVCWNTSTGPTIANTKTTDGAGTGSFTSYLTGLSASTTYYARAYSINASNVSYGNEVYFTTTTPTIPVLDPTTAASLVTTTTATSGGNLTSTGNAAITERGICYSTTNPPTTANTRIVDGGTGLGSFTSNLTGLTSNTVYYVRSYAINSVGAGYGAVMSFTTQAIVSTTIASAITTTTASSGGTITVGGGAAISERGVCWGTSSNPTIAGSKTSDGTATGVFTSAITGLSYTTLYHVRAYATNANGTVYGSDLTFTTLTPGPPALAATTAASAITGSTATSGGNVTSNGGAPITERGIVYSLSSNPTVLTGTKVIDGTPGTGIFTSNMTGLNSGAMYYVKAYATNIAGTSYGAQISFTTRPTVSATAAATSITATTATTGGTIAPFATASLVWYYGVAYSTTSNAPSPTLVQTGSFPPTTGVSYVTNLTGLTYGTLYYIRAYATGNGFTVYGPELSFTTTGQTAPIVASTNAITIITDRSATSGGSITSDGGSTITAKGVCWSISPNPVKGAGNFTSNGTGNTPFTSNITGLASSTLYYVRAYATNAIGTSYGPADVTFTTTHLSPYALGDYVGYGWVVYVDPATGGGLIVSTDISSTAGWGCNGLNVAVGTALGTGQANTNLILATDLVTRPIAASVADDYSVSYGGTTYSDWYLPSSGEWGKIYAIASTVGVMTGTNNYYTSSQYGTNYTMASTYFTTGGSQLYSNGAQRIPGINDYVSRLRVMRDFGGTAAVAPTVLSTYAVTSINDIGGTSGGYISSDGGATVSARGVCWGTATAPVLGAGNFTTNGTGMGSFTSIITGLTAGTPYYVRAYATNSAGTTYGPEINFTPITPGFPTVSSTVVSAIGATTATTGGNVTDNGGGTITERGVCYGTTSTPTIANSTVVDPNPGTGAFTSNITGLTTGQLYYVRAYATNGAGTSYGAIYSFTPFTFATVTTDVITNIAATSATSGGNVTSENGSAVTARGVCYGTTSSPTIVANFVIADIPGTGTGTFVSNLTGLTLGLTYYARAYATNAAGTAYGNEEIFVTAGPTTPTVTTDQPTNGTETTVTSGGTVTNDGGSTVTARGVVWSATGFPPTLADPHTIDGSGTGTFTSSITGLTTGNYYTIIAYATNSSGTAYGNEVYYTPVGLPNIGPGQLTYFPGDEFAQIGLNIMNDGGSPITACGAVWNTLPNPTVELNGGISIENLAPMPSTAVIQPIVQLTTYYVRAYVTNSFGTSYSPEIIFTPGVLAIPTITTDPIINKIGAISEGGATVLSDGGEALISAGLCWGTAANPTVDINLGLTADGYLGQFYSIISGLTVGTTYHVRAYATNGIGTGYGADITFTATAAYVGQVIQGGWIFGTVLSVDLTGEHGIIADTWGSWAATDWGCYSTTTGATGMTVGTGASNTTAIINDITINACSSSQTPNGLSFASVMAFWNGPEWYLPSKDEVDFLHTQAAAAGLSLIDPMWSSTESDATHAWYFDGTMWSTDLKSSLHNYWPIRNF